MAGIRAATLRTSTAKVSPSMSIFICSIHCHKRYSHAGAMSSERAHPRKPTSNGADVSSTFSTAVMALASFVMTDWPRSYRMDSCIPQVSVTFCMLGVMPNHVHALFTPKSECTMSEIVHSWKSFTAHECNKVQLRTGQFWAHEPFDRYIRNQNHFYNSLAYIENNPVEAGLCEKPEDWIWSSAQTRLSKHIPGVVNAMMCF